MKCAPPGLCPALKLLNIWPFPLESRCFSLQELNFCQLFYASCVWNCKWIKLFITAGTLWNTSITCTSHPHPTSCFLPSPEEVEMPRSPWEIAHSVWMHPCDPPPAWLPSWAWKSISLQPCLVAETNSVIILVNTKHFINSQIHTEFGSPNKITKPSIMNDIPVIDALENVHCEPIILFWCYNWVILALELD